MMSQRHVYSRNDQTDRIENLNGENIKLKRQLVNMHSENTILKVKVRRLEDELSKRQRQIYNLLDPQKTATFRKFVSEHGASLYLSLKERQESLIKALEEKESCIRRLTTELNMARIYRPGEKKDFFQESRSKSDGASVASSKTRNKGGVYGKSGFKSYSSNDMDMQKEDEETLVGMEQVRAQSMDRFAKNQLLINLQTIKQNASRQLRPPSNMSDMASTSSRSFIKLKSSQNQTYYSPRRWGGASEEGNFNPGKIAGGRDARIPTREEVVRGEDSIMERMLYRTESPMRKNSLVRANDSPQSDIDRIEVENDAPHEEIVQLQTYFLDMLDEMDNLKSTVIQLQAEQMKTSNVLQTKEETIENLAKQVRTLRTESAINQVKSLIDLNKKKARKGIKKSKENKNSISDVLTGAENLIPTATSISTNDSSIEQIREFLLAGHSSVLSDPSKIECEIDEAATQTIPKIRKRMKSKDRVSSGSSHKRLENHGYKGVSPRK